PSKPGGRHPPLAQGMQTSNCLYLPSTRPSRLTMLSVETGLLQATQVALRALLSFALSLGIAVCARTPALRGRPPQQTFILNFRRFPQSRRRSRCARRRAERDSDQQGEADNHGQREASRGVVRTLLLGGAERRFGMSRMDARMVAALRGIVDAGAGDAARTPHAAWAHGDVGAPHADGQARP